MIRQKMIMIIKEQIRKKLFPGAVIGVTDPEKTLFEESYGTFDGERKTTLDTIYDLASMTKITATLPSILLLIQDGLIDPEDPVQRFIAFPDERVRVWHLLTHTSGMPPYSQAYRYKDTRDGILKEIQNEPFRAEPGSSVVYSCLNYILLMRIVEAITGSFSQFTSERIYNPLGMENTQFVPQNTGNIAPTSIRNDGRLRGLPDDELAYHLDGISGNAGLFSTVPDILKYARELLYPGKIFSQNILNLSRREWTRAIPGDRKGLGWMLWTRRSSGGCLLSENSFGHTGFTGTSLWIDPEKELAIVILTNKCFYSRHQRLEEMWRFRRITHNVILSSIK